MIAALPIRHWNGPSSLDGYYNLPIQLLWNGIWNNQCREHIANEGGKHSMKELIHWVEDQEEKHGELSVEAVEESEVQKVRDNWLDREEREKWSIFISM